jgi:hypothetical protein
MRDIEPRPDILHFLSNCDNGKQPIAFLRHSEGPWWWVAVTWCLRCLRRRWVTVGNRIFYPDKVHPPYPEHNEKTQLAWMHQHLQRVAHELAHVAQWHRYGKAGFLLRYFVFPLPVFYSGRYFLEREAYAVDVRWFNLSPGAAATNLCSKAYGWSWPRSSAELWFEAQG